MCGIAGAIGRVDQEMVEAVRRASVAQRSRGPDGEGEWRSHPERDVSNACFAHRRLAIIDLSPAGAQPMVHEDGTVICFNGEVYNFRELRAELEELGEGFSSDSDTEVVLAAYRRWGTEALARLQGMFALALWDPARQAVLLVRDRLGIKPLYLAQVDAETLMFASEIRALLASGRVAREFDPQALAGYLWLGHKPGVQTVVAGVRELPPGTFCWVDSRGVAGSPERFWRLPLAGDRVTPEAELEERLQAAVRMRLISDRPLGVFLSGGVDSSAVAAIAARQSSARIKTFNLCFEEQEFDESGWARQVAAAIGSEHHEVHLSQSEFRRNLPEALASLDHPTFDGLNTWFVSKAVHDAGMTVALSGAGGDELFGGYRSFVDMPRAIRISRMLRLVPMPLLRLATRILARWQTPSGTRIPPQTRWGKLEDLLASRGDPVQIYQTCYSLFTSSMLEWLSAPGLHAGVRYGLSPAAYDALSDACRDRADLPAVSALELASFIGLRLLTDTDCTSMSVSLEVRVPLLDHRVVEASFGLPDGPRYQPLRQKMCLRRMALADLDPAIFDRPKAGFVLPTEVWSKHELAPAIEDCFADPALCARVGLQSPRLLELWSAYKAGSPGIYWTRIWSLFTLLRWAEAHSVQLR